MPRLDSIPKRLLRAGQTAIILNKNAKRVSQEVKSRIAEVLPEADIFFTESIEQAAFITRRVVELGYSTVVTGGGDGTIFNTIDGVLQAAEHLGQPIPRFAILRLGTGNAVADFVGAGDYLEDLKSLKSAREGQLPLLRVNGARRASFVGFGWDAFILNRYHSIREQLSRFWLGRKLFQSALGYFFTSALWSVPELLIKRPRYRIRVRNTGGIALRLDPDGQVLERFAPGATVYEGYSRLTCAGTTPFYGFRFKMMPFANSRPGFFHLRIIDKSPLEALIQGMRVWVNGRITGKGIAELMLSSCEIEILDGQEAPWQVAGDAEGSCSSLKIAADGAVDCLYFQE